MPEKEPNNWIWLITFIKDSPTIQGAIMAMIIAALRLMYDGERKPLRIGLESALCGALSLCTSGFIDLCGVIFNIEIPVNFIVTVSGAIGFIGVTSLREFILKAIQKRIDKK